MPLFDFDISNSSFFYIILLAPVWRNKFDTDWHSLPFQLFVLESGESYSIFTTFEREAKTSAPQTLQATFRLSLLAGVSLDSLQKKTPYRLHRSLKIFSGRFHSLLSSPRSSTDVASIGFVSVGQ